MNKDAVVPLLLDLYGNILSDSQRVNLEAYYSEDLSLSEIADNIGKSRQGVFDSIKRAEIILTDVENKLRFLEKINKIKEDLHTVEKIVKEIQNQTRSHINTFELGKKFEEIFNITDKYKHE